MLFEDYVGLILKLSLLARHHLVHTNPGRRNSSKNDNANNSAQASQGSQPLSLRGPAIQLIQVPTSLHASSAISPQLSQENWLAVQSVAANGRHLAHQQLSSKSNGGSQQQQQQQLPPSPQQQQQVNQLGLSLAAVGGNLSQQQLQSLQQSINVPTSLAIKSE